MRRFAVRLIIFIVLFLVGNKIYTLINPDSDIKEADKRLYYLLSGNMNKDVIVTGASSGSAGIIAGHIEDEIGLSAYNLCYLGTNIEFHEFIVRTLVKFNDPPKILLLVLDDSIAFKPTTRVNYKKDLLYPMFKYKYIREELAKREGKGKLVSGLVAFFRAGNFNVNRKLILNDNYLPYLDCGSRPIPMFRYKAGYDWSRFSSAYTYSTEDELDDKLDAYKNIISICHQHGIIPVTVFLPIYPAQGEAFQNRVRQMDEEGVLYFSYDKENPVYGNHEFYYDDVHLKINGAEILTQEVIQYLESLVLPQ